VLDPKRRVDLNEAQLDIIPESSIDSSDPNFNMPYAEQTLPTLQKFFILADEPIIAKSNTEKLDPTKPMP
jgi:hypothetical protein